MNEYLNVIRNNYANFTGRARRREYWMFTLINVLVQLVLRVLDSLVGLSFEPGDVMGGGWLSGLYSLLVIIPHLAVMVRRLHDTGRSGWSALLALIPLINLILLVLLAEDSKPGANKWGPNPKAPAQRLTTPARNW